RVRGGGRLLEGQLSRRPGERQGLGSRAMSSARAARRRIRQPGQVSPFAIAFQIRFRRAIFCERISGTARVAVVLQLVAFDAFSSALSGAKPYTAFAERAPEPEDRPGSSPGQAFA